MLGYIDVYAKTLGLWLIVLVLLPTAFVLFFAVTIGLIVRALTGATRPQPPGGFSPLVKDKSDL